MDRRTVILALDVPEGLVDAGDGTHEYRSAAVKSGSVEFVPDAFDLKRIPADERLHHFDDRRLDGGRLAFDDRFTPADKSFVRLHFQKQPSRRYGEQFIASDLHSNASLNLIARVRTSSSSDPSTFPFGTSAELMPSAAAPASRNSLMLPGVTPPVGSSTSSFLGASTSLMEPAPSPPAGNTLILPAPAAWAL